MFHILIPVLEQDAALQHSFKVGSSAKTKQFQTMAKNKTTFKMTVSKLKNMLKDFQQVPKQLKQLLQIFNNFGNN